MRDASPPVRQVRWFPQAGRPSLYLASLLGTPVSVALAIAEPFAWPEVAYGAVILVAALPIYFMTEAASASAGQPLYSWWGLRAQAWLHIGGAAPAAIRHRGERPEPPRHTAE